MDLGKTVVIKGELSGSEDFTVYGQMEGSIRLPDHTLTIGPHAHIKAEISAKAVVIMGALIGNASIAFEEAGTAITIGRDARSFFERTPARPIVHSSE